MPDARGDGQSDVLDMAACWPAKVPEMTSVGVFRDGKLVSVRTTFAAQKSMSLDEFRAVSPLLVTPEPPWWERLLNLFRR